MCVMLHESVCVCEREIYMRVLAVVPSMRARRHGIATAVGVIGFS